MISIDLLINPPSEGNISFFELPARFFFTQKLKLFPADLKSKTLIFTAVQTRVGLYSDRGTLHYCTLVGVRRCPRGCYVHGRGLKSLEQMSGINN